MNNYQALLTQIQSAHEFFSTKAQTTINQYLTLRNWSIGYYIVEYEQDGEDRAQYGKKLIANLAKELQGTKGLDKRALFRFRQFYLYYPQIRTLFGAGQLIDNQSFIKVGSLSPQLNKKVGSMTPQLDEDLITESKQLISKLSY